MAASPGGGEGSQKSTLRPARLPASRGPVKTLSGPARRWREARTAGKVLRNQHFGRLAAGVQSKRLAGRPGVDGKPARRGRFSEINILAGISPIFKTRARRRLPGVSGKPARRGRFSEINNDFAYIPNRDPFLHGSPGGGEQVPPAVYFFKTETLFSKQGAMDQFWTPFSENM